MNDLASTASAQTPSFYRSQEERRLSSGDRILIVTDIYAYESRMVPSASDQLWFRVGAVNLKDNTVGFWRFTVDDARAMLKAGITAPPWSLPHTQGIQIKRELHGTRNRMGRYRVTVTTVPVPADVLAKAAALRRYFDRQGHVGNFAPGSWNQLEMSAARELAVEKAALGMVGIFKSAHVTALVGKGINVSPVLRRLVREGRLTPVGKKYIVTPPKIIERADWTN